MRARCTDGLLPLELNRTCAGSHGHRSLDLTECEASESSIRCGTRWSRTAIIRSTCAT